MFANKTQRHNLPKPYPLPLNSQNEQQNAVSEQHNQWSQSLILLISLNTLE